MSLSQEISSVYKNLKDINNGLDVEGLVYNPKGFLYSNYPEEWNEHLGKHFNQTAPVSKEQKGKRTNFNGDIVYCERLWNEFEDWCLKEKGINLN